MKGSESFKKSLDEEYNFPATYNFIKSNLKSSLFFDMKKWIEELQIKELQL